MIDPRPEAVVRRQVEAFNARDLDAFLDTYAHDAVVTGASPDGSLRGAAAMRAHYAQRLREPGLRCELSDVAVLSGRWVVAHERVTARDRANDVIAVFDVRDGVIARADLIRP